MSEILFEYHRLNPTTWVYLSSLLMIGLFFKFGRFWSIRNLDLILLVLLAPGLLLVHFGRLQQESGEVAKSPPDVAVAAPASPTETKDAGAATGGEATIIDAPKTSAEPTTEREPDAAPKDGEPPSGEPEGDEPGAIPKDRANEEPSVPTEDPPPTDPADEPSLPDDPIEDAAEDDPSAPIGPDEPAEKTELPATGQEEPSRGAAEPPAVKREEGDKAAAEKAQVDPGQRIERLGFIWLFAAAALLLIRLLLDPTMVRRPLLEPNLSVGGMVFIGCALFVFLMGNVVASKPIEENKVQRMGPGYRLIYELPRIPTHSPAEDGSPASAKPAPPRVNPAAVKTMAILAHLAVVVGIVFIGYRHYDNIRMGIGAALIYLLLPYTAQMTGRVDHVLPAALLVWACAFYRRPLAAGIFLGLAAVIYYPLYLLPLWISFYWRRGLLRFILGAASTIGLLVLMLLLTSGSGDVFWDDFQKMFGLWKPEMQGLGGFWDYYNPAYRLPLLAAFIALSVSLAIWPAQKNLGTLLGCSAAVMVATQFWHSHDGGTYVAWYLPLLLLTIFRPNLEDRVALSVLSEGWFPRRRPPSTPAERTA